MKCFKCQDHFCDSSSLCKHLRFGHGLYDGNKLRLKCGQDDCLRTFNSFSGYKRHLCKHHAACVGHHLDHGDLIEPQDNAVEDDSDTSSIADENREVAEKPYLLTPEDLQKQAAAFICNISANSTVTQSCVNHVVNAANVLVGDIINSASAAVSTALKEHGIGMDVCNEIQSHLTILEKPFDSLDSEFKRMKYFKSQGMVEPREIKLGTRFDSRLNKVTRQYEQVVVDDTFIYVPILETLKLISRHSDVFHYITHDHISVDGVIRDFCDAKQFQNSPLFKQDCSALQLHFFYDDFETVNPLGSKTKIHKLGGFYFVVKNLPPKFNSCLHNIHLAALCHTEDIKKYGYDEILKHIVDDINLLSLHGIELAGGHMKKGTITQFSADNLGANSLFGFVESFMASHYCRLCLLSKEETQNCFRENEAQMRTLHSYNVHTEESDNYAAAHVFGVKRNSVLNDCIHFHVLSNFSMDIMHDLLEGVVQYEMKLVLKYFIEERMPPLMSLDSLNKKVSSYSYGFVDSKNKPSEIKLNTVANTIGQKAMQSWCSIRYLPFIIGYLEDEKDRDYFQLLLKLLDCMDIIFSPQLTLGLISQLRFLIEDHHHHFVRLFPDRRLLPKHHFMVHYPTCLEQVGPLIHVWCMRYEAKHDYFCRVADTVRNFKNICKTVAKRHQITQMYHMNAEKPLEVFEVGPGSSTRVAHLGIACAQQVTDRLPNVDLMSEVTDVKWVNICGSVYHPTQLVCYDMDQMPVFGQIYHLLTFESRVYFVLKVFKTLYFSDFHHAYAVKEETPCQFVTTTQSELVDHQPLDLHSSATTNDDIQYVSPRHVLFK